MKKSYLILMVMMIAFCLPAFACEKLDVKGSSLQVENPTNTVDHVYVSADSAVIELQVIASSNSHGGSQMKGIHVLTFNVDQGKLGVFLSSCDIRSPTVT